MENTNREFELRGLNHVAMVCKDMQRTMDFYTNILGMKLIRTLDLPGGSGQHFFFDMGGGQCFAFFWFPEAPDRNPGVSNPRANIDPATALTDPTGFLSSHGSMNHFAFDVAPEKINTDPYGSWIFKVKPAAGAGLDGLMDAAAYEASVKAA